MKNVLYICLFFLTGAINLQAQFNGEIDSTFAQNGILLYDYNEVEYDDVARAARIDENGKIYIGGYVDGQNRDILITRFNADGSPDNTFGSNGGLTYDPSLGGSDELFDMVVADGKIYVFGVTTGGNPQQLIARFNDDGTLDNTFNGSGSVITGNSYWDMWTCGLVDQNGRIVVAGLASDAAGQNLMIARFNNDGTPDNLFGFNGVSVGDYGDFEGFIDIFQAGGSRYYLSAIIDGKCSIFAIDNNGDLISAFDGDGRKVIDPNPNETETIFQILTDDENDIYLIGESVDAGLEKDIFVAKLYPNGSYDTEFGVDGVYKADLASNEDDMTVSGYFTANGGLVLGGFSAKSGSGNLATVMISTTGFLDAGYGTLGVMEYNVPGNVPEAVAGMISDEDGHLYLFGSSYQAGSDDLVMIRLKGESASTAAHSVPTTVQQLMAYPQPTSGQLFLNFELTESTDLDVELFDLNGRLIAQKSEGYLFEGTQTLDLSEMLPTNVTGMYVLRLKTNSDAITLPISLQQH